MEKEDQSGNIYFAIGFVVFILFFLWLFSELNTKENKQKKEIVNRDVIKKEVSSFQNYKIENKGELSLDLKGVNTLEVKNSGNLNMAVSTDYVGNNLTASDCNERFVFHSRSTCQ